jgi:archaemetzincin
LGDFSLRKILLVPLTRGYVYDFLNHIRDLVVDSFSKAGVSVEVLVWPSVQRVSMKCFSWDRKQYFAPCILSMLQKMFRDYLGEYMIIGIGYLDGYDEGLNFVFGEASPSLGVAVVFTTRLNPSFYGDKLDYNLYVERVVKEVVHETGHLFGLGHCSNPECVMSFSNSVLDVDRKTRFFCDKCSGLLRKIVMSGK